MGWEARQARQARRQAEQDIEDARTVVRELAEQVREDAKVIADLQEELAEVRRVSYSYESVLLLLLQGHNIPTDADMGPPRDLKVIDKK